MSRSGAVVIVGAGQAGYQAAVSLRDEGFDGPIRLIGDEPYPAYQRPPLSKMRLSREGIEDLAFAAPAAIAELGVDLALGRAVTSIDRVGGYVFLNDGTRVDYAKLVLATGARNRRLNIPHPDRVYYVRGIDDAIAFGEALETSRNLVVIGGGFLGLEMASMACDLGLEVDVVEATATPMGRVVSALTAGAMVARLQSRGVRVHTRSAIVRFAAEGERLTGVYLEGERLLKADLAVVSIGVAPNVELAAECGLAVTNGIVVSASLQTAAPNIYAIGDCAVFPHYRAASMVRLESVQNAVDQGRHVAASILGRPDPYTSIPWFWSEQGGSRLQIAGISAEADDWVVRGNVGEGSFSTFCFRGGALIAVESVNRPADHMAARRSLSSSMGATRTLFDDPEFDFRAWLKTR